MNYGLRQTTGELGKSTVHKGLAYSYMHQGIATIPWFYQLL